MPAEHALEVVVLNPFFVPSSKHRPIRVTSLAIAGLQVIAQEFFCFACGERDSPINGLVMCDVLKTNCFSSP